MRKKRKTKQALAKELRTSRSQLDRLLDPENIVVSLDTISRAGRTLAVTATIVCVPLEGMFAGLFAGSVLPQLGWRPRFLIGGAMPVLFALLLFFALPESPWFLARHRAQWPELSFFLPRFMVRPALDTCYTDQTDERLEQHKGFPALLKPEYRRDSIALWCAFFFACWQSTAHSVGCR
jgi:AAHS family 4-hydroxybenzoate transporter-like MFS transporter